MVNISPSRKGELAEKIPESTLPKLPAKFTINLAAQNLGKKKKGEYTPKELLDS